MIKRTISIPSRRPNIAPTEFVSNAQTPRTTTSSSPNKQTSIYRYSLLHGATVLEIDPSHSDSPISLEMLKTIVKRIKSHDSLDKFSYRGLTIYITKSMDEKPMTETALFNVLLSIEALTTKFPELHALEITIPQYCPNVVSRKTPAFVAEISPDTRSITINRTPDARYTSVNTVMSTVENFKRLIKQNNIKIIKIGFNRDYNNVCIPSDSSEFDETLNSILMCMLDFELRTHPNMRRNDATDYKEYLTTMYILQINSKNPNIKRVFESLDANDYQTLVRYLKVQNREHPIFTCPPLEQGTLIPPLVSDMYKDSYLDQFVQSYGFDFAKAEMEIVSNIKISKLTHELFSCCQYLADRAIQYECDTITYFIHNSVATAPLDIKKFENGSFIIACNIYKAFAMFNRITPLVTTLSDLFRYHIADTYLSLLRTLDTPPASGAGMPIPRQDYPLIDMLQRLHQSRLLFKEDRNYPITDTRQHPQNIRCSLRAGEGTVTISKLLDTSAIQDVDREESVRLIKKFFKNGGSLVTAPSETSCMNGVPDYRLSIPSNSTVLIASSSGTGLAQIMAKVIHDIQIINSHVVATRNETDVIFKNEDGTYSELVSNPFEAIIGKYIQPLLGREAFERDAPLAVHSGEPSDSPYAISESWIQSTIRTATSDKPVIILAINESEVDIMKRIANAIGDTTDRTCLQHVHIVTYRWTESNLNSEYVESLLVKTNQFGTIERKISEYTLSSEAIMSTLLKGAITDIHPSLQSLHAFEYFKAYIAIHSSLIFDNTPKIDRSRMAPLEVDSPRLPYEFAREGDTLHIKKTGGVYYMKKSELITFVQAVEKVLKDPTIIKINCFGLTFPNCLQNISTLYFKLIRLELDKKDHPHSNGLNTLHRSIILSMEPNIQQAPPFVTDQTSPE